MRPFTLGESYQKKVVVDCGGWGEELNAENTERGAKEQSPRSEDRGYKKRHRRRRSKNRAETSLKTRHYKEGVC